MSLIEDHLKKIKNAPGFIGALDQSGGSTPKALGLYGLPPETWSNDEEMYDLVHTMRTRIVTSPAFTGERILGAILFEMTMDKNFANQPAASYLWKERNIVPFLKIDKGLADEADGVQLMKPIPGLPGLLARARANDIFGTKMRSVVKQANSVGIKAIVDQQFEIGSQIIAAGLVPIIEPEIDIHCPDKAAAENLLLEGLLTSLDQLATTDQVMLKLTLPEQDNLYAKCIVHPRVLKVVALSGGYSRDEANERLARQQGVVASFSRALSEGLTAQMSDEDFNATLDASIESIFKASVA